MFANIVSNKSYIYEKNRNQLDQKKFILHYIFIIFTGRFY